MPEERTRTSELLERWHGGDAAALSELLATELPWIAEQVRRRLGPLLRRAGDTGDFVQNAIVRVLRDGPRFVLTDVTQFRALVARMVENVLRDEHDRLTAGKRDVRREVQPDVHSVVRLDALTRSATTPSQAAGASEWRALVRVAMEFLAAEDREVLVMRLWDELSLAEIGARLDIAPKSAHMRFARALPRLAARVADLRAGRVAQLLDNRPRGSESDDDCGA